ncbi:MAG: hypothetical protein ACRELF_12245, partial [Gemmataceae bacterium]
MSPFKTVMPAPPIPLRTAAEPASVAEIGVGVAEGDGSGDAPNATPTSFTESSAVPAPSEITSAPVSIEPFGSAALAGLKVSAIVHLLRGASSAPQVLPLTVKGALADGEIAIAAPAALNSLTVFVCEVFPIFTLPNDTACGLPI